MEIFYDLNNVVRFLKQADLVHGKSFLKVFLTILNIFKFKFLPKSTQNAFVALIVQLSQKLKIFRNKKQYTAKLKFVWNKTSDLWMQQENSVRK